MDKIRRYQKLIHDTCSILAQQPDPIVWMSSLSCLLRQAFGHLWVGFYRVLDDELLIGPYQGGLACLRIPFDQGVCGACASGKETIIVPDVHRFPGHISCDARSRSEIVVPVFDQQGELKAVLDIDSDRYNAFDQLDQKYLEQLVGLMTALQWKSGN